MLFRLLTITFFLLTLSELHAQTKSDSLIQKYMQDLRVYADKGDYVAARKTIGRMAALNTALPNEVAYYYGLAYMNTGDYVSAKTAFRKYLDLIRGNGEFKDTTIALIRKIDCDQTGFYEVEDTCRFCSGTGEVELACTFCERTGKEYCSTCRGTGVMVTHTAMGDKYQECMTCKGTGVIECSVCRGTLVKKSICSLCGGRRTLKSRVSCTH